MAGIFYVQAVFMRDEYLTLTFFVDGEHLEI